MYIDGAWRLAQYKRDMDNYAAGKEVQDSASKAITGIQKFNLGTFNMPSMEGTGIEAKARTIEVAVGFVGAVKKDQEHNDMVVDFLMYWSSPEGQSAYQDAKIQAGGTPNGPNLVDGVELPAEYADMFKNLTFIGNCQKGYGQMIARGAPGDVQQSLRDWYNYSESFLNGEMTVDQWAAKHKANVEKYFTDALKVAQINASDLDNPQNAPTGKKAS
jgi:raffinose/stachyose/melibiose transport system substrate-binding protein